MHVTFKLFVPSGKKFKELHTSKKRCLPTKICYWGFFWVAILNIVPKCQLESVVLQQMGGVSLHF